MFASPMWASYTTTLVGGPTALWTRTTIRDALTATPHTVRPAQATAGLADGAQTTRFASARQASSRPARRPERAGGYLVVGEQRHHGEYGRTLTPTRQRRVQLDAAAPHDFSNGAGSQALHDPATDSFGSSGARKSCAARARRVHTSRPVRRRCARQPGRRSSAAGPANTPVHVSLRVPAGRTPHGSCWGPDDTAPYRVFPDVTGMAKGPSSSTDGGQDDACAPFRSSTYGVVGGAEAVGGGVGDVTHRWSVIVPGKTT